MLVIFFPRAIGANPEHFAAAGLADLAADGAPSMLDIHSGPNGEPGQLAYFGQRLPPMKAEAFQWQAERRPKAEGPPRYWLGRVAGENVAPVELARRVQHVGREITLADGQAWKIPEARQLPKVLGLDEEGRWTGQIDRQYEDFWNRAWGAVEWFLPVDGGGRVSVDFDAGCDFCCRALAINYRVNPQIVSFLGLLRSDLIFPIAKAVTELDVLVAARAEKKTAEGQPSPASGDGDPG